MKLKETKTVICGFKNGKKLILENIVTVFTHDKMIELYDSDHVGTCVMLNALDYYMVKRQTDHKDFTIDWDAGYEAACDDIRDFAQGQIEKRNDNLKDDWDAGHFAGMMDIIEFIERMGTDERN